MAWLEHACYSALSRLLNELNHTVMKTLLLLLMFQLREAESAAVRNNCLVVLGDLCVRYTGLVDRHIGAIAVTMQVIESPPNIYVYTVRLIFMHGLNN